MRGRRVELVEPHRRRESAKATDRMEKAHDR